MAAIDQPVAEELDDRLNAAIAGRRHRDPRRGYYRNP